MVPWQSNLVEVYLNIVVYFHWEDGWTYKFNFISRVGGERGKAGKDYMQRYIISIQ